MVFLLSLSRRRSFSGLIFALRWFGVPYSLFLFLFFAALCAFCARFAVWRCAARARGIARKRAQTHFRTRARARGCARTPVQLRSSDQILCATRDARVWRAGPGDLKTPPASAWEEQAHLPATPWHSHSLLPGSMA